MEYNNGKFYLPLNFVRVACLVLYISFLLNNINITKALPILEEEYNNGGTSESALTTQNTTDSDLYVIRAVVYEIGVLTDADNTTEESTERHEKVNLLFYDPPHKDDGLLNLNDVSPSTLISTGIEDDNSMPSKEMK